MVGIVTLCSLGSALVKNRKKGKYHCEPLGAWARVSSQPVLRHPAGLLPIFCSWSPNTPFLHAVLFIWSCCSLRLSPGPSAVPTLPVPATTLLPSLAQGKCSWVETGLSLTCCLPGRAMPAAGSLPWQWALQTNKGVRELWDLYGLVISPLWKPNSICGIWWRMVTILLRALFGACPSQRPEHGFVFIFFSKREICLLPSFFSSHLQVTVSSLFTKTRNLQGWQQRHKRQNQQDCISFCLVASPSLVSVQCRID